MNDTFKVRPGAHVLLIAAFILVGCWRITATYDCFWQTWDEPFHIAAGLE